MDLGRLGEHAVEIEQAGVDGIGEAEHGKETATRDQLAAIRAAASRQTMWKL